MKKQFLFTYFILFLMYQSLLHADKGTVVKVKDDKIVISYSMGFLLLEWYGGHLPSNGDVYVGSFNSYGMKELFCISADSETRFWIEEYMADKQDAMEFLYEN